LNTAREKSRAASCQNNLKQIGLCFLSYADDNDDYLPYYFTTKGYLYWFHRVGQYIANPFKYQFYIHDYPLMRCPSQKAVYLTDAATNYIVNYWVTGDESEGATIIDGQAAAGMKRTKIKGSSNISLVADGKVFDGGATSYLFNAPNSGNGTHHPGYYHSQMSNILWVDGHVAPLKDYDMSFEKMKPSLQ
jgi:prepilin-type processing-associated H-X9-DG protein